MFYYYFPEHESLKKDIAYYFPCGEVVPPGDDWLSSDPTEDVISGATGGSGEPDIVYWLFISINKHSGELKIGINLLNLVKKVFDSVSLSFYTREMTLSPQPVPSPTRDTKRFLYLNWRPISQSVPKA